MRIKILYEASERAFIISGGISDIIKTIYCKSNLLKLDYS